MCEIEKYVQCLDFEKKSLKTLERALKNLNQKLEKTDSKCGLFEAYENGKKFMTEFIAKKKLNVMRIEIEIAMSKEAAND